MKQPKTAMRHAGGLALAAAALVATVAAQGGGGGGQQANQPPVNPAAPTKALVPVAASTLAAKPDAYVGEFVTVSATVEKSLSKLAFTIDQDRTKTTGQEVLVLAQRMTDPVEPNGFITVIGELVKYDAAATAEKAKAKNIPIDAPADVLAQWAGKPVILASSVINARMQDLARFVPPPTTPEEQAFDKTMKSVAGSFGALRKGIDGKNAEMVKTNSDTLVKAFTETELFMKTRKHADAIKVAGDARTMVLTIAKAGAAGSWDEAKAAGDNLAKVCGTCHTPYRERLEDGSYRYKPAAPATGTGGL
jgi:cytochrome c556